MWSENTLCVISVFLNLFNCILWPRIRSILQNILCEPQKNVYSAVKWNNHSIKVNFIKSNIMLFRSNNILTDLLPAWNIKYQQRGLKFSTIIVGLSISPYDSISFCLMYYDAYTFGIVIPFGKLTPFHYVTYPLFLRIFLVLRTALPKINTATPA